MRKLILFDIDNTIFDSAAFRKDVFQRVHDALNTIGLKKTISEIEKMVDELIEQYGFFDPDHFVKLLSSLSETDKKKIKEIYVNAEAMKQFLYKEMIELVSKFSELGEVGILSQGQTQYQLAKFAGISTHFHPQRIHILPDKKSEMANIFKKYDTYKIYYIDDLLVMLRHAKENRQDLVTIWSNRGMHKGVQDTSIFKPDLEIDNLTQAYEYIRIT